MPPIRMPSMATVAAAFLGTAAGCVLFLFGVDRLAEQKHKPPATPPGTHVVTQADTQATLKRKWDEARGERDEARTAADGWKALAYQFLDERNQWRERATVAESRLANCEQRLVTAKALTDAARREAVRVAAPPTGDEEGSRIPPQMIPVP